MDDLEKLIRRRYRFKVIAARSAIYRIVPKLPAVSLFLPPPSLMVTSHQITDCAQLEGLRFVDIRYDIV